MAAIVNVLDAGTCKEERRDEGAVCNTEALFMQREQFPETRVLASVQCHSTIVTDADRLPGSLEA